MVQTKKEIESNIRELQSQYEAALIAEGSYKLAKQRLERIRKLKEQLKQIKDSCNKVFTKGSKDDDATENGSIEEYGKNHETEKMSPEENPVQAQDDLSSLSKNWTPENIKHILANPHLYKPEVVEEAKRRKNSLKDSDPKIAEAMSIINLCGGVM